MATRVQTRLTCDLDDDDVPAVATTSFDYEGESYVLDLCAKHLEEFRERKDAWMNAARPL